MKQFKITRTADREYTVLSGVNTYKILIYRLGQRTERKMKWSCTCQARGMCDHLRAVIASSGLNGLAVGDGVEIGDAFCGYFERTEK